MRHLRKSNHGVKNLSVFKKQIGSILRKINQFNEAEKTEALSYLRQCLNTDEASQNTPNSNANATVAEGPLKKRKRKLIEYNKLSLQNVGKQGKSKKSTQKTFRRAARKPRLKYKEEKPRVKPVLLKCRVCNATKKTKKLLLKHLEMHVGTPISCLKCKQTFNSSVSYDWHVVHFCKPKRVEKRDKKFKCSECLMAFCYKRHLDRHSDGHKRNNCTYCDVVLTKRKQLAVHLLEAHAIKLETAIHKCEQCDKKFVKKRSLFYHMRQHSADKLVCMECGFVSNSLSEHSEHTSKHEEQKLFKCPQCNDRFSRRQQYLHHMKRHDRYKCLTCSETFASKARVVRHKQRGHQVEGLEPTMACPYCSAAFHRKVTLQLHMMKHSEVKPTISCKYCNKTFQSPYAYFKHCMTAIHEKQSPDTSKLVCENCGKQFTKKYLLEQHMHRIHGQEKQPHSCDYCDYKTNNKTNLKRHVTLHLSSEKTFICDQCGKSFSSITSLKDHVSHMHTYSQERNFNCEQCGKSFKRNSELVRHRASHSNVRPFVCTLCNQSYKRNTHLRRHEETVHKKISKKKKVQRLKVDNNGVLVPVPNEKKPKDQPKREISESDYLAQPTTIDYFNPTMKIVTSPENIVDQNLFTNQQNYWNDKFPVQRNNYCTISSNNLLPNASNSMQTNELVTLNIVDQLVNTFIPDKVIGDGQNNFYDNYAEPTVHYNNVTLENDPQGSDILTAVKKDLHDQSRQDYLLEQPVNTYVPNYQYLQ